MRIMMHVDFPHRIFNEAVKDGTAGTKMNKIIEDINPEAVYFTEQE